MTSSSKALKRALERVKNWSETPKSPNNIKLVADDATSLAQASSGASSNLNT